MSFTKQISNNGPNTLPCGIPLNTDVICDIAPLMKCTYTLVGSVPSSIMLLLGLYISSEQYYDTKPPNREVFRNSSHFHLCDVTTGR